MTADAMAWSRERLRLVRQSDFVRQVAATFGTRVLVIAAGLASSVIVARALGPEGRGTMAVAVALTSIAIQVGNLGLHASNTWAVSREPLILSALIANSVLVAVSIGLLASVVVIAVAVAFPSALPISGPLLTLSLIGIPIGLASLLSQNLFLGIQRVREYNVVDLANRALTIVFTVGLIAAGLISPVWLLGATTAAGLLVAAWATWWLAKAGGSHLRPRLDLFRRYGPIGLRAYAAALISFLLLRFDLLLVQAYRGFTDSGQYSVAAAMAELTYALPVVIGSLLFPRLARMDSPLEQVRFARSVAERVAILMVVGSIVAAALAGPVVRLLYGEAYAPAAPAFVWLLPGVVALSLNTVIMNYAASVGFPRIVLTAPFVALILNIGLNVLLLPEFGIVGASIASTIAYAVMLAFSGSYFIRRYRTVALASA